MPIGRYTRLDEIGRGSFATVYQGVHTVRRTPFLASQGCPHSTDLERLLTMTQKENAHLCCHQIRQPVEAQQEAERQSILRDPHP